MRRRPSLRRRAAFGIAALAIIVVGAHSAALYYAAEAQEDNLMDRIVSEELDHLVDQFRKDASIPPSRSQLLTTYIVRGDTARADLPDYLWALPDGFREIALRDGDVHVGVRTEAGVRFYAVYDVTYSEERIRQLGWLLVLGVAITAAIAAVLGYWVAGLVVRPVATLAERVDRLGPSRPPQPLASDFVEREIASLAKAIDGYLDRVTELVEREREFTANVSHELRTPLTSIQTGCELLSQRPTLAEDDRRRVESIDRAARRLADTARSLLYLARGVGDPLRLEEISVQECVGEAAEPVLPLLASKSIVLETEIDSSATVRAERTALFLVVDNLLRNAVSYTEQGHIRAVYRDGILSIEDSGPGIEASVLQHVGERFYRGGRAAGDGGLGLGLAIVKRICERFEWRLEIASSAGAGTRVSVHFPLPSSQNLHNSSTDS